MKFFLARMAQTVPLLLLLSFFVFSLFSLIPGDFVSELELNPSIPQEQVVKLRQSLGLNEPFPLRYLNWLSNLATGDWGYSFSQRRPAARLISERLGNTVRLSGLALTLTLLLAVPAALLSSRFRDRWPDKVLGAASLVGLSLPAILSSILMLYWVVRLGWRLTSPETGRVGFLLPALTLAIPMSAFLTRTLRAELIAFSRNPLRLAWLARGLRPSLIAWRTLRHALNPAISLLGVLAGGLLSGSVVVESVFGIPGLGRLTISAILQRDVFVALDCVLVAAALIVLVNLLSDLLLAANDPRIRLL